MTIQDAIRAIKLELEQVERTYRENRQNREPATSIAYDEGRRRGLLDALDVISELEPRRSVRGGEPDLE